MNPVVTPFDPADYLDSEDMIGQYLTQVMMEGDADEMIEAIGHRTRCQSAWHGCDCQGIRSWTREYLQSLAPRFQAAI